MSFGGTPIPDMQASPEHALDMALVIDNYLSHTMLVAALPAAFGKVMEGTFALLGQFLAHFVSLAGLAHC